MRKTSVRELHIHTSELVREAADGGVIVIERRGQPVAELRPITSPRRMPAGKKARIFASMRKSGPECRKPATVRRSSKRIGVVSRVYFDTSYIAKFYFNEPESPWVRALVRKADTIQWSRWALAGFHAVLQSHIREGASSPSDARELALRFSRT
jgi:prevent-host-death family protein